MNTKKLTTKRGAKVNVLEAGSGSPLVFLHGAGGLFPENPFLDALAKKYHVYAPEFPGFGESSGEELLDDMLDFALHGWDVVYALGLEQAHLIGHSMGGMIAAEMAAIAPNDLRKLVLVGSAGLWIPEHPIPDLFAMMPHELPEYLCDDPVKGLQLLTGGLDFSNLEVLAEFYLLNQRRMGVASKILFPIPNRGTAKRLHRVTAETLIVWGANDRLIPPVYAERWKQLIAGSRLVQIKEAGHLVPYEQPEVFVSAVSGFLG